jgi:hypothetical protein
MVDTAVKFNLVDNKLFHDKLQSKKSNEPVDCSNLVFNKLKLDPIGKCYYPFFLREPFSLKDFDFCELIDSENLKQLQDKKIIPLVCMLSEGWQLFDTRSNRLFRRSPYYNVINQLEKNNIREEDVVWMSCNRYLIEDSRIKSKFIHFDFFLEQQKVLENKFLPLTEIKHKYLSMARGVSRHHRYAMTYQLYNNDLFRHGAISCTDYKNFSYNETTETTDEYISKLEKFNESTYADFKTMLPLTIDSNSTKIVVPAHKSYQSPINLHQDGRDESHLFENVFVNLVNETHQPGNAVFITEKTYRSINYCRPFIINGDSGSLQYLKEMGFQTFDKFWDESYDTESSDHERINKITKIIQHICGLDHARLMALYESMLPTLEHNYKVLKDYEQWSTLN